MRFVLSLFVPLLLLGAGLTTVAAADAPAAMSCCNDVCPIDGKPVNKAIAPVDVKLGEGADAKTVPVGTCSDACAAELKAHPADHAVQVWASMKDQQVAQNIKGFKPQQVSDDCCNTTCPVDGKPIDPSVPPVVYQKPEHGPKNPAPAPTLIGFCSGSCREAFLKSPEKFATPEWFNQKTKPVKVK